MATLSYPFVGGVLVIEVETRSAEKWFSERAADIGDVAPLLKRFAVRMRADFDRQFAIGGDPAWKPLAPSTAAYKIANKLSDMILIAKGDLRKSYVEEHASGHIEKIDDQNVSVVVGSNFRTAKGVNLAVIHQRGTRAYTITARNGRALRFIGSVGDAILRRSVRHPGIPARPVRITPALVRSMKRDLAARMSGTAFSE